MPLLIAHRGLIDGPNPEIENKYETLLAARRQGFDVEVDVWYVDGELWVGHDKPDYKIQIHELKALAHDLHDNDCHAWIHCKNIDTVEYFNEKECADFNFFYHETDAITLTNRCFLWTYPGKQLTSNSICVLPEDIYAVWQIPSITCYGFCSDRVKTLKDIFYPKMNDASNRGW